MSGRILSAVCVLALVAGTAQAGPLVEDTISYSDGTLAGNNGGTGWTTGWIAVPGETSLDVASGVASDTSTTTKMANVRGFDTSLFTYGSGSIWTSVNVNLGGELNVGPSAFMPHANGTDWNAGFAGLRFYTANDGFNDYQAMALFLKDSGSWFGNVAISAGEHQIVMEADMTNEKFRAWIDPDINNPGGHDIEGDLFGFGGGVLTDSYQYTQLWSEGGATNTFDNIRYGATFADVAVPEPASLVLLGLGGLMLAGRRRRAA